MHTILLEFGSYAEMAAVLRERVLAAEVMVHVYDGSDFNRSQVAAISRDCLRWAGLAVRASNALGDCPVAGRVALEPSSEDDPAETWCQWYRDAMHDWAVAVRAYGAHCARARRDEHGDFLEGEVGNYYVFMDAGPELEVVHFPPCRTNPAAYAGHSPYLVLVRGDEGRLASLIEFRVADRRFGEVNVLLGTAIRSMCLFPKALVWAHCRMTFLAGDYWGDFPLEPNVLTTLFLEGTILPTIPKDEQ